MTWSYHQYDIYDGVERHTEANLGFFAGGGVSSSVSVLLLRSRGFVFVLGGIVKERRARERRPWLEETEAKAQNRVF